MKLIVLSDNRTRNSALKTEHGLCVYLDTGKIKVLLDTGASDVFISNATILGIDLSDVDYVFISHGHWDHAGGLRHILTINDKARVIISPEAINGSFYSSIKGMHDISPVWPHELMKGRIIPVYEEMEIEGLRVMPCTRQKHTMPKADGCLYRKEVDDNYINDDFRHELILQFRDFLFTGCAHSGLLNIMESGYGEIHTVLGGFHLLDSTDCEEFESDMEIRQIALQLLVMYPGTVFYTGHCTGDKTYMTMKDTLGDNLEQFSCGFSMEIAIDTAS